MDQPSLESKLADLCLPAIRFFDRIDSTNDEAWRWLNTGAPHGAIVIADEQTAGRGRSGRRWITPAGSALAFSLILLAPPIDPLLLSRLSGLGALAVNNSLLRKYSLPAQIKWPNDILIDERKVGGVLVEARWSGRRLEGVIIGIGINIASESVNAINLPPAELNYPATCVEAAIGHAVDRQEFLHAILGEYLEILPRLSLPGFIQEWKASLAFMDQWVELASRNHAENRIEGKVVGLNEDGSLKLVTTAGNIVNIAAGEIHLRPAHHDDLYLPPD